MTVFETLMAELAEVRPVRHFGQVTTLHAATLMTQGLSKRARLGDRVMVEVAQVDLDRRELNLRYIGRAGGASTQSAGGKKQQSRKPKGDSQQFRSGKKQSSKGDSKGKAKGRKTGSQSRSRRDRGSR